MINILIVDDSETETAILKHLFEEQPDFKVIGCAKNGAEAVKLVAQLKPDLVTMDLQMPVMDGLEATRLIMAHNPTPIVVISSKLHSNPVDEVTFHALNAGALSVLAKPIDITADAFQHERRRIIDTIRGMAEIKTIKRRIHVSKQNQKPLIPPPVIARSKNYEIVAIGASIGGTQALNSILSKLPANFPVPIVVVQHMIPGFIGGFAKWLNDNTSLEVKEINDKELLKKGTVYFAPDYFHLEIQRKGHHLISNLVKAPPVSSFCPSITFLLQSVAKTSGKHAIGMLLTGMGNDGADGLLAIKQAHGHTLIQDQQSSIVFGMAGVAQSLGAVDVVVNLDLIADHLISLWTKA